jgi:hypothetical protein
MALSVVTQRPRALLRRIREAIAEGTVTTWRVDGDGDLTHTSEQWGGRLWLRPTVDDAELRFTTVPPQETRISTVAYAYYHGHFIQMLLTHFDGDFETVIATADASLGDRLGRRP